MKRIHWTFILMIFMLLGVFFYFKNDLYYEYIHLDFFHSPKEKLESQHQRIYHKDIKTLEKQKPKPKALFKAIKRLSRKNNSKALKAAIHYHDHSSTLVRRACASALQYNPSTQARKALFELLKDTSEKVRVEAIESLSTHSKHTVKKKLQSFQAQSLLEKVALLKSRYLLSQNKTNKHHILNDLIDLSKKNESEIYPKALKTATKLNSRHTPLKSMLKNIIFSKHPTSLKVFALKALQRSSDSWIREHIKQLLNHPSERVQKIILYSIDHYCPSQIWKMLRKKLKDTHDLQLRFMIIRAARRLGGQKAHSFLKEISQSNQFSSEIQDKAQKEKDKLKENKSQSLCQKKTKENNGSKQN